MINRQPAKTVGIRDALVEYPVQFSLESRHRALISVGTDIKSKHSVLKLFAELIVFKEQT